MTKSKMYVTTRN